jgi:hypothetical protein
MFLNTIMRRLIDWLKVLQAIGRFYPAMTGEKEYGN